MRCILKLHVQHGVLAVDAGARAAAQPRVRRLAKPVPPARMGVITQYVVFSNADGTYFYCADCTQCAAYARQCTRYRDAECKEPVATATDFVFPLAAYCVVNVDMAIYHIVWLCRRPS